MNIQPETLFESVSDGGLTDEQALADFHAQTAHWWLVDKMVEQPVPDPEPVSVLACEEILLPEPVLPKVLAVHTSAVTELHFNVAQPYLPTVKIKTQVTPCSSKNRKRRGGSKVGIKRTDACKHLIKKNEQPFPKSLNELRLLEEGTLLKLKGNPELLLSVEGAKRELRIVLMLVLSGTFSGLRRTFIKVRRFETGSTQGMSKSELKLYNLLRHHIAV